MCTLCRLRKGPTPSASIHAGFSMLIIINKLMQTLTRACVRLGDNAYAGRRITAQLPEEMKGAMVQDIRVDDKRHGGGYECRRQETRWRI